jgi:hypothetical protein
MFVFPFIADRRHNIARIGRSTRLSLRVWLRLNGKVPKEAGDRFRDDCRLFKLKHVSRISHFHKAGPISESLFPGTTEFRGSSSIIQTMYAQDLDSAPLDPVARLC